MIDKCQRFVGRNKIVSHGDCVKSSNRTLHSTIGVTHGQYISGVNGRMGKNTATGPASAVFENEEPATQPGLNRLQSPSQQSVNQAQDGPWVVVVPFRDRYRRAFYAEFLTWGEAYDYWWERPGSLLCKNLTPV